MVTVPVKIYSAKDSSRLRYIAGIILGDILGLQWDFTTDKRKLGKHPVINYSTENLPGSFKISPESILFEKGIAQKEIIINTWKGLPVFFQTTDDSDLPFDVFAASFYLATRYEEYLEFEPDKHGRFPASASVAYKNGFLGKPIIDLWAKEFAKSFLQRFSTSVFRRNEYNALLTIDTDQAFEYQNRNIFSSIGRLFRDKNSVQTDRSDRYHKIAKGEKDPFDVFDYIIENIEKSGTDTRFFFPVGDHSKFDIGLHPSFTAGGDGILVNTETDRLRHILGKKVSISRFHYLILNMPGSYNNILKAGISEDCLLYTSDA